MAIVISRLIFNSKHHDKCQFGLKLISLVATSNLFSLEVVQKCQHCELYLHMEKPLLVTLCKE